MYLPGHVSVTEPRAVGAREHHGAASSERCSDVTRGALAGVTRTPALCPERAPGLAFRSPVRPVTALS